MTIVIISMDGKSISLICKFFEFRSNQVANWIKVVYEDDTEEMFHNVAVIRGVE